MPNNFYTPTKAFVIQPKNEEKSESFVALQNKLLETQKQLNEEILRKNNLENSLKEQQFQYETLSKSVEEFKLKMADQSTFYTEQRNQFEEAHSKLTHRIFHLERSEEGLKLEIEELKRKSLQDNMAITNKEEEIKDLNKRIEKLNESLREREGILSRKVEELDSANKRSEEYRNEVLSLKNYIDKLEDKLRTQESTINGLSTEGDFSGKKVNELKDKLKDSISENEKLRFQNNSMSFHLNQCQSDLENCKSEIYQLKQGLLEKQQKEINLVLALEKANLETNQYKKILQRTEFNIEEQKNVNRNLVDKISEFASTANTSNLNNLKFFTTYYEPKSLTSKPEGNPNNFENDRVLEQIPSQMISQGQGVQPRKPESRVEGLRVDTARRKENNERPYDYDPKYDSFNDRDNRFRSDSIDFAAGADLGKLDSGKKLFVEKFRNSNILSWDAKENERKMSHSIENRGASAEKSKFHTNNRNTDNQNFNSLPTNGLNRAGRNQTSTQSLIYNNSNPYNRGNDPVIDENAGDVKSIEKNLLALQIQKQEMENELRKLEDAKIRTGASIRRKNELEESLKEMESKISRSRLRIRELTSSRK